MKDNSEFSLIRHGRKLDVGEERKSLQESGLTQEQQDKWQEAVEALDLDEPELAYDALPRIEELAQEIYKSLPDKANLMFVSSNYPRTKLTSFLLSGEITRLVHESERNIGTA